MWGRRHLESLSYFIRCWAFVPGGDCRALLFGNVGRALENEESWGNVLAAGRRQGRFWDTRTSYMFVLSASKTSSRMMLRNLKRAAVAGTIESHEYKWKWIASRLFLIERRKEFRPTLASSAPVLGRHDVVESEKTFLSQSLGRRVTGLRSPTLAGLL